MEMWSVTSQCVNKAPIEDFPCTFYQSVTAIIITTVSSIISVVSSLCTIFIIFRSQLKLRSVYHRIMFGMSISDVLGSLAMGLTTIPMPTDMVYAYPFSFGTYTTCRFQSYLYLLGSVGSLVYVTGLCLFYYCLLKKQMSDKKIVKVEIIIHVFAMVLAVILSTLILSLDLSNPTNLSPWCSFAAYPYECTFNEDIECQRGNPHSNLIAEIVVAALTLLAMILVAGFMIAIIIWAFSNGDMLVRNSSELRERDEQKSLRVVIAKQALMYLFAFLLSWIWIPIIFFTNSIALQVLSLLFFPLQGFFNAIIFIYHKVYNIKMQSGQEMSTKQALYIMFAKPGDVNEIELTGISKVERDRRRNNSINENHSQVHELPVGNGQNDGWSQSFLRKYDDELSISQEFSFMFDVNRENKAGSHGYSIAVSNDLSGIQGLSNEITSMERLEALSNGPFSNNDVSSMDRLEVLNSDALSTGNNLIQDSSSVQSPVHSPLYKVKEDDIDEVIENEADDSISKGFGSSS